MELDIPEPVLRQLTNIESAVASLKEGLHATGSLTVERLAGLPPVDRAQALVATILATQSLFLLQQRLGGRDPSSNDLVRKENSRLQQYTSRVRKVMDQGEKKKRELTMDVEAVNRFIAGAVSDKTQKQGLLELSKRGKKKGQMPNKKQKQKSQQEQAPAAQLGKEEFVGQVLSFGL